MNGPFRHFNKYVPALPITAIAQMHIEAAGGQFCHDAKSAKAADPSPNFSGRPGRL